MLLFATTLSVAAPMKPDTHSTGTSSPSPLTVDWWPMFHHDLAHTGFSTSRAPETNRTLWTASTGSYMMCSPPAVYEGKVYSCGTIQTNSNVYCFNADDGTLIWSYQVPGSTTDCTPTVAYGKVYVGTNNKILYCLDALGNPTNHTTTKIWSYQTNGSVCSSPSIVYGNVYFGCVDKNVYCLNATGNGNGTTSLVWKYLTGAAIMYASPTVVNGKVYIGSTDNYVYCLNATGNPVTHTTTKIWSFFTNSSNQGYNSPVVMNGRVYIGSDKIYCLDAQGNGDGNTTVIWSYPQWDLYSSLVFAYGNVYFGSSNRVFCLNATGNGDGTTSRIWLYNITSGLNIQSAPAVADEKVFIVGVKIVAPKIERLYCLNAVGNNNGTTTKLWDYTMSGDSVLTTYSSPAIADNKVYISSSYSKKVYCFRDLNMHPDTPATPTGPTSGQANVEYTFTTSTTDPEGNQVSYGWDWNNDGIVDEWTGLYNSGESVQTSHIWNGSGTYPIRVKAKDDHTAESGWSSPLTIVISANQPPGTPNQPTGPTSGYTGVSYTYSTSPVTDPDGDPVTYLFDWGDSTNSGWVASPSASHTWSATGTYNVKVKAKDTNNASSGWSSSLAVTITAAKPNLTIDSITGGKGITIVIKNVGDAIATNVIWNITIDGGLFVIPRSNNGTIPSLAADNTSEVTMSVFGFGLGLLKPLPTITVHAVCTEGVSAEKTVSAKIFFSKVTIQ